MKTTKCDKPNSTKIALKNAQAEVIQLKQELASLKEQIEWFTRQLFGKKSEKIIDVTHEKQVLLPGMDAFFASPDEESKAEGPGKTRKNRKKAKRDGSDCIKLPPGIRVDTIIIDLPEDQKVCSETGVPLVKIGEETTYKLAYTPGSHYIKKIVRFKYVHPEKEEAGVFCPELPGTIFPKCRADDSLLAEILVKKYADHLPLYRISEILKRDGIEISRKLLSQWAVRCGAALTPLYNEMLKQVLSSGNIFVDESPINVQAAGKVEKGYMWVIVGGNESSPPYRIYDFYKDRSHDNILKTLKNYQGFMHSDKYAAYEKLSKKNGIIWGPCWAHIRRYFFEVEFGDLEFRKWILRKIHYLYMLERVGWNRSAEERLKIRQEKELPIIEDIINRVKARALQGDLLPKSKLSKAINYFIGLIPHVKNYLNHPYSRMDNNVAERAVRPLAIGRKNWLFFGSLDAGQSSAIIFSLIQTCRGLGINSQEYLEDVFRRLLDHSNNNLHELLPDQWLLTRK